jgi:hypothetical protein
MATSYTMNSTFPRFASPSHPAVIIGSEQDPEIGTLRRRAITFGGWPERRSIRAMPRLGGSGHERVAWNHQAQAASSTALTPYATAPCDSKRWRRHGRARAVDPRLGP